MLLRAVVGLAGPAWYGLQCREREEQRDMEIRRHVRLRVGGQRE